MFNTLKPNELSYLYQLDQSILGVLGGIFHFPQISDEDYVSKQCEDPDQTPHYAHYNASSKSANHYWFIDFIAWRISLSDATSL